LFDELFKPWWMFVAVLLIATAAEAQVYTSGYVPGGYYARPYYGYGGYGYGYGAGIGSTAAGSYLGGMASAIRAQGQYNQATSAAAINLEQAEKLDIENQVRWTNAYIEMRKMKEAYHKEQEGPPTPPETWARLAHAAATPRLTASQLDPVTGSIAWPALLQGADFKADRAILEKLFADRAASHGAIGAGGYNQIRDAVDAALDKLKTHIQQVPTREYNQSRNFLTSLGYEANFPAG
jgi:hypothetical protein